MRTYERRSHTRTSHSKKPCASSEPCSDLDCSGLVFFIPASDASTLIRMILKSAGARVYVSCCEQCVRTRGYRPQWVDQSTSLVSSIILDPHPIMKEAGIMEHATSNVARLRRYGYIYRAL